MVAWVKFQTYGSDKKRVRLRTADCTCGTMIDGSYPLDVTVSVDDAIDDHIKDFHDHMATVWHGGYRTRRITENVLQDRFEITDYE